MDAGNQWVALVYGGVHLLATVSGLNSVLMKVFAKKNVGCALDLVLSVVDGVCRMDGIVSLGVEPVSASMHEASKQKQARPCETDASNTSTSRKSTGDLLLTRSYILYLLYSSPFRFAVKTHLSHRSSPRS